MWLAVLDAEGLAALGSHTSLELAGFKPFAREAKEIHLIVHAGRQGDADSPGFAYTNRGGCGLKTSSGRVSVDLTGPRLPAR